MRSQFGLTLVELLVTIAIVGVLASVILARVTTARDGAKDTKIMTELDGLYKNGLSEEIAAGTYDVVCGSNGSATATKLLPLITSIQDNTNTFRCNSDLFGFAASAELSTTTAHWCVDSEGNSGEISAALGSGVTACP